MKDGKGAMAFVDDQREALCEEEGCGSRCFQHREKTMVSLKGTCFYPGCSKKAIWGLRDHSRTLTYGGTRKWCSGHRGPHDIDLKKQYNRDSDRRKLIMELLQVRRIG